MHKSETDWMHARGQPASARAWPAAIGQLAGFHFASARVLEYLIDSRRARMHVAIMHGGRPRFDLRAPGRYQVL